LKLLLDTHAFLWFVLDDAKLKPAARGLISDPLNRVLLSPASYWEIAIKVSLGKYRLPGDFGSFMDAEIARNNFEILPITLAHASIVATLPLHHGDPFDRMLIAQAIADDLPIASADVSFDAYPVTRYW